MKYTVKIPDLSLKDALAVSEYLFGSMIFTDQKGNSRGDTPNPIHGEIEKLSAWPSNNELTITKQN